MKFDRCSPDPITNSKPSQYFWSKYWNMFYIPWFQLPITNSETENSTLLIQELKQVLQVLFLHLRLLLFFGQKLVARLLFSLKTCSFGIGCWIRWTRYICRPWQIEYLFVIQMNFDRCSYPRVRTPGEMSMSAIFFSFPTRHKWGSHKLDS